MSNSKVSNGQVPTPGSAEVILQWPKSKGVDLGEFTIHGTWGYPWEKKMKDKMKRQNIPPTALDKAKIQHLETRLIKSWPNLEAYDNKSEYGKFWENEWKYHGFYFNLAMYIGFRGVITQTQRFGDRCGCQNQSERKNNLGKKSGGAGEELLLIVNDHFQLKDAKDDFSGDIKHGDEKPDT